MKLLAKLTDKQKKAIIAAYSECRNYTAVAKKHKVSRATVKKLVDANPEIFAVFEKKQEENTRDILAYMDTKRDMVCDFVDLYMEHLTDPVKLRTATLNQISTAFGTVIDKFTHAGGAAEDKNGDIGKLIAGLKDE